MSQMHNNSPDSLNVPRNGTEGFPGARPAGRGRRIATQLAGRLRMRCSTRSTGRAGAEAFFPTRAFKARDYNYRVEGLGLPEKLYIERLQWGSRPPFPTKPGQDEVMPFSQARYRIPKAEIKWLPFGSVQDKRSFRVFPKKAPSLGCRPFGLPTSPDANCLIENTYLPRKHIISQATSSFFRVLCPTVGGGNPPPRMSYSLGNAILRGSYNCCKISSLRHGFLVHYRGTHLFARSLRFLVADQVIPIKVRNE